MTKKRNKFWSFVMALLPGAAHMFMGFMKRGLSLMALFFLTFALASWLNLGPLMYVVPIIWFYGFFDGINLAFADDDVFAQIKDDYLFSPDSFDGLRRMVKNKAVAGVALIIVGVYVLFRGLINNIYLGFLPPAVQEVLYGLINSIPQFALAVVIIIIGISLIRGKKNGGGEDE